MLSLPTFGAQNAQCYQAPTVRQPKLCISEMIGLERPIDGQPMTEIKVADVTLEVMDSFCYLGDSLNLWENV